MAVAPDLLEHAYFAGGEAHRNGRGREKCPNYAMGEDGEALRAKWRAGWDDAARKRGR